MYRSVRIARCVSDHKMLDMTALRVPILEIKSGKQRRCIIYLKIFWRCTFHNILLWGSHNMGVMSRYVCVILVKKWLFGGQAQWQI